jgi:hypothetical protein
MLHFLLFARWQRKLRVSVRVRVRGSVIESKTVLKEQENKRK